MTLSHQAPPRQLSRREFVGASGALALATAAAPSLSRAADDEPATLPPVIDAHTHFYDPERPEGVPWPGKDDKILYRRVLPPEFVELTRPLGVTGTIIVEASPWLEDNAWLLELAQKETSVVGVVGNLTPGGDGFRRHLARFAKSPFFLGIRVNEGALQAGLDEAQYHRDLAEMADRRLALDVNGGPNMLRVVARAAEALPELRFVVNHAANLPYRGGTPPVEWSDGLARAAERPNVYCKVSALVEGARVKNPSGEEVVPEHPAFYTPMLDALWKSFGPKRLIFASNWPVSARYASYAVLKRVVDEYVAKLDEPDRRAFYADNAQVAYRYVNRKDNQDK